MIPMHTVSLVMVVLFGLIGSLRGWAKELIVIFSVFLALFIEAVLIGKVGAIQSLWGELAPMSRFWIRIVFFGVIVLFGYASPTLVQQMAAKIARERLQDLLLGSFIGLLNGILIVGTLWFCLDEAHYGVRPEQVLDGEGKPVYNAEWVRQGDREFDHYAPDAEGVGSISPPDKGTTAWDLRAYLPPQMITDTALYLLVGLAFAFVIIVFI